MNQVDDDPMNSAMDAEYTPRQSAYFGQIQIDTYFCVLVKGKGKEPFNSNVHKREQRCTSVSIAILPLPTARGRQPVERNMIAESKEWAQIVKPSLRDLGVDLRSIHGKWAQVVLAPTGRTYTAKDGSEKMTTTFRFVAVYDTEEACQAASDAFFASSADGGQSATDANTGAQAPTAASGPERETALKFLPALWNAAGKDPGKFADLIAANSLVAKYFTLNSPEVIALVAA